MRYLRFVFLLVFLFGSFHFSFSEVGAADYDETDASFMEETDQIPEEDVQEQEDKSDSTDIQTPKEESNIEAVEEQIEETEIDEPGKPAEEKEEKDIDDDAQVEETTTFSAPQATLPFKQGDRHEDLIEIKQKLNAIGFGGISETDYFGSWTTTRVKQFQEYYGLSVTGEINKATIDEINKVYHSPFQLNKRHDSTIELKEKLNALGYGHISVTNLYGEWTVNRVKKFQGENGLRVNGIADGPTWAKLDQLFSAKTEFKVGDRHPNIVSIKQKLNAIGFGGISETDYYGDWTETRVTQFQEYYGLKKTGTTNQATLDKLNEVYNSPFQLGKRHASTIELKEKLNSLGYGHISVTDLYGEWTVNRVKKFQKENGLRVNGIADGPTWAKLDQLFLAKTEFKVGDRHPNIVSIKQKLNKIGFGGISETDYYGDWTETRVTQFQEYYGLKKTGTTNQATLDKLNEVYNSPFQLGKRHASTIELKEKLNSLGYGHISVTDLYGEWTVNRVKKFQSENGLRVNGIADSRTWAKLDQLLAKTEFKVGDRHPNIVSIKQKLNAIGFGGISETNYYGDFMKKRVSQFQKYYGLSQTGTTNSATIKKLNEVYNSPFQLGKRHKDTVNLKKKLNRIGFGYITESDLYGSFTKAQVEKFQRHYGLKVNGIADPKTHQKINEIYNSPLQKGKRNKQVIDLKRNLNALGYDGISLTNYFGSWTETRLKQFQKDNNLPVSGIADEKTLRKIEESQIITIFIDPGHGGADPGSSAYGIREKDVVLDIAKSLERELAGYAGVRVILSRTADNTVSLMERTNAANNLGVNFYVSLHTNAHTGSASGFESYIYNGAVSQETIDRQKDIHNHIAKWLKTNNGIDDRGAKRNNFHVLRESSMPSLLIEYMFIDNEKENNLLQSKSYRDKLGIVTAQAIAKSFNLTKK